MYYVIGADGQQYGPIDEATVREWLGAGRVGAASLSFRTGEAQWIPLRDRPEMADLGAAPPQPPAGGPPRPAQFPGPPSVPSALPADAIGPENAKDPIVILVLALFLGGIAYFVLGQWQKGLAGMAVWVSGVILSIITCGIGAILMFPVVVLLVVDAYSQAKVLKEGRPIGQWTFLNRSL